MTLPPGINALARDHVIARSVATRQSRSYDQLGAGPPIPQPPPNDGYRLCEPMPCHRHLGEGREGVSLSDRGSSRRPGGVSSRTAFIIIVAPQHLAPLSIFVSTIAAVLHGEENGEGLGWGVLRTASLH